MAQFIKAVHALHYFAEALSWGAIAYSAFLIAGRGWLGILCGGLALIVTIVVWSLFASARAVFRTPIAVIVSRTALYIVAVGGLLMASLPIEAIILAVLLVLTEGTLTLFKAHPALHPHSGGQARLVANDRPLGDGRTKSSGHGPRIVPGVQATSGVHRTGVTGDARQPDKTASDSQSESEAKADRGKADTFMTRREARAARIVGETPKDSKKESRRDKGSSKDSPKNDSPKK